MLDEINGDSLCLFNTMIVILLFDDDAALLSKLGASLHKLMNKLYEFCISVSFETNLARTKIMIFGHHEEIKPSGILPR